MTAKPTPSQATPSRSGAPTSASAPASSGYRDGTYAGTGWGLHGPISVAVTVAGGRIASTQITSCGTRYPCSYVAPLAGEVIASQSVRVDMVSGATASSEAFLNAVAQALGRAG